ncbi:MAG TPA: acetyl-CoA carboxylase biotin carboxylase subunit [Casimicrobiaceae bacterium]|nr:acetyl-CoA carboxylase biotin carboxylase subunit [Casimicrobiaceae bacterium]
MRRAFRRVLVANRGEIAVRIIRACHERGLEAIQAYSEADRESLAVALADGAICIGPSPATQSYLKSELLVDAARTANAEAIHPGYGFLSENASFARACEEAGIVFIGPSSQVIAAMGDKAVARRMATDAGVPTTPGSRGTVEDTDAAREAAEVVGYPVLLKASAGGGGRGMRVVRNAEEVSSRFAEASREASTAFGDGTLYVEKFMPRVRHVEIQVLSDGERVLHLGERDCSIQRRNQKLVEESPSPALDDNVRARMGEAAVRLCREARYKSAGTVEFIVDAATQRFFFIEVNARVQVEHPVTEMVTGIDIVKHQIAIAQGEQLSLSQEDVRLHGHAIECRINAENPARDFRPSPGQVRKLRLPGGPGIRVDTHLFDGYTIPPFYDSLIAKLIAWGNDRDEALARMRRALSEMHVEGIHTTIPFHRALFDDARFTSGDVHTRFVEDEIMMTT